MHVGQAQFADHVSDTSLCNATAIGFAANVTDTNHVRIGNDDVGQIGGVVGWTTISDRDYKTDIQNNTLGLEFINQLRPISYGRLTSLF
jgi:hypothetical protein